MTHQQIAVPICHWSWWLYHWCRALLATIMTHIRCICSPSHPMPLVWHVGNVQGHGSWSQWLLINSQDLEGAWDGTFASLAPPHYFLPRFMPFTWVGTVLGHQIHAESIRWKCLFTTKLLQISSFTTLNTHHGFSFFSPVWTLAIILGSYVNLKGISFRCVWNWNHLCFEFE
jgi:hypothetical protein